MQPGQRILPVPEGDTLDVQVRENSECVEAVVISSLGERAIRVSDINIKGDHTRHSQGHHYSAVEAHDILYLTCEHGYANVDLREITK